MINWPAVGTTPLAKATKGSARGMSSFMFPTRPQKMKRVKPRWSIDCIIPACGGQSQDEQHLQLCNQGIECNLLTQPSTNVCLPPLVKILVAAHGKSTNKLNPIASPLLLLGVPWWGGPLAAPPTGQCQAWRSPCWHQHHRRWATLVPCSIPTPGPPGWQMGGQEAPSWGLPQGVGMLKNAAHFHFAHPTWPSCLPAQARLFPQEVTNLHADLISRQ